MANAFDNLCQNVERWFPQNKPMLSEARLFMLEERESISQSETTCLRSWHPEEQVIENFRLPFDCVAIASGTHCEILQVISAAERRFLYAGCCNTIFSQGTVTAFPDQFADERGRLGSLAKVEDFAVFHLRGKRPEEALFSMKEIAATREGRERFDGLPHITAADCHPVPSRESLFNPAATLKMLRAQQGDLNTSIDIHAANAAFMQINSAILAMLLICEPSRFIVEQFPIDGLPKVRPGEIARTRQRRRYIVLEPGEIKRRLLYDENDPTGIPKMPHERRGHYRKLTHERYKAKRDHVIWVKPCWVGKTEAVRGKNKYVVRLDL